MCFGSSAASTDNLFNRRPTDEQRMMSHAHTTNRQCKRSLDHRRILSPSKPRPMDCVALGARPESHHKVSPKIPHSNGIAADERGRTRVDCDDAMVESQTEGHICFKKMFGDAPPSVGCSCESTVFVQTSLRSVGSSLPSVKPCRSVAPMRHFVACLGFLSLMSIS